MPRDVSRSTQYQYMFHENIVDHSLLTALYESLPNDTLSQEDKEKMEDLQIELAQIILTICKENFNEKYYSALVMYMNGATQQEIGDELGTDQSSARSILFGRESRAKTEQAIKGYKGLFQRIYDLVKDNDKVNDILKQIKEIISNEE